MWFKDEYYVRLLLWHHLPLQKTSQQKTTFVTQRLRETKKNVPVLIANSMNAYGAQRDVYNFIVSWNSCSTEHDV